MPAKTSSPLWYMDLLGSRHPKVDTQKCKVGWSVLPSIWVPEREQIRRGSIANCHYDLSQATRHVRRTHDTEFLLSRRMNEVWSRDLCWTVLFLKLSTKASTIVCARIKIALGRKLCQEMTATGHGQLHEPWSALSFCSGQTQGRFMSMEHGMDFGMKTRRLVIGLGICVALAATFSNRASADQNYSRQVFLITAYRRITTITAAAARAIPANSSW